MARPARTSLSNVRLSHRIVQISPKLFRQSLGKSQATHELKTSKSLASHETITQLGRSATRYEGIQKWMCSQKSSSPKSRQINAYTKLENAHKKMTMEIWGMPSHWPTAGKRKHGKQYVINLDCTTHLFLRPITATRGQGYSMLHEISGPAKVRSSPQPNGA